MQRTRHGGHILPALLSSSQLEGRPKRVPAVLGEFFTSSGNSTVPERRNGGNRAQRAVYVPSHQKSQSSAGLPAKLLR